jgi:hypothetical protein
MCDCIDSDSWVCFRGQNIVGIDRCPCPCHKEAEGLEAEAREAERPATAVTFDIDDDTPF